MIRSGRHSRRPYYLQLLRFVIIAPLILFAVGTSAQGATPPVLALSEISPRPRPGRHAWVEIRNTASGPVTLGNFRLVTDSGYFTFGGNVAQLPAGEYLVVCFDSADPEPHSTQCLETSFTEHAPVSLTESWSPRNGRLEIVQSVGGSPRVIDGIRWGVSPTGPDPGPSPGSGRAGFVLLAESTGLYDASSSLQRGESIALLPEGRVGSPADWAVFAPGERTRGLPNRRPAPRFFTPPSGAIVDARNAVISWLPVMGVEEYRIQVSKSSDFVSFVVDESWEASVGPWFDLSSHDLSEGTYYYRVCSFECATAPEPIWGRPGIINLKHLDCDPKTIKLIPGMKYAAQRKDTPLLCLEMVPSFQTGIEIHEYKGCDRAHWDRPHLPKYYPNVVHPVAWSTLHPLGSASPPWTCDPDGDHTAFPSATTWGPHGEQYCMFASLSMLVSGYGKCLSQDRIAFYYRGDVEYQGDGEPEYDLGHNLPVYCFDDGVLREDCPRLISWALGLDRLPPGSIWAEILGGFPVFSAAVPEFATIEKLMASRMPILFVWERRGTNHASVINGTCRSRRPTTFHEQEFCHWIHVLDPWVGGPQWWGFCEGFWRDRTKGLWVNPPTDLSTWVRKDEASIWLDGDGDGMVDFDENTRFHTMANYRDSDRDGVWDKNDVHEYVFFGKQCLPGCFPGCTIADFDGDREDEWGRKELDRDNDEDGCLDGDEDSDGDGIPDTGTTAKNNFNSEDCRPNQTNCPGSP